MSEFLIRGGRKLKGELMVQSSKNACLPLIAATLLTEDPVRLKSIPNISDIRKMLELYKHIGGNVLFDGEDVILCSKNVNTTNISSNLVGEIRSSIFLLGPMLAKYKKAEIAYPGGCKIGARPIDLHLKGFESFGVQIKNLEKGVVCEASKITGGIFHLDFPSVGATENLIMLGTLSVGERFIISNAAREPEIVDLANFINEMGGKVYGAGTSLITIEGVEKLHGVDYKPINDRIVTGTYMIATAMAGGNVVLKNSNSEYLYSLILKLRNSGCKIGVKNDIIKIESFRRAISCPIINTQPYPGFPTDLQAQMLSLQTVASGVSVVTENLFESRFNHVSELVKMGAKILLQDRVAIINGVDRLKGATVHAQDLRGGAALVLAGLVAEGQTIVKDINYIERGYVAIDEELNQLGAHIERR